MNEGSQLAENLAGGELCTESAKLIREFTPYEVVVYAGYMLIKISSKYRLITSIALNYSTPNQMPAYDEYILTPGIRTFFRYADRRGGEFLLVFFSAELQAHHYFAHFPPIR